VYTSVIEHNDALLPTVSTNAIAPDFGVGIYYTSPTVSIGIAALQLLQPSLTFTTNTQMVTLQSRRHYYATATYNIALTGNWSLSPTLLIKSDFIQHQLDVGLLAQYDNFWHFGINWRGYTPNTIEAASVIGGIRLQNGLSLSYAYDFVLSHIRTASSGTHELSIRYQLNKQQQAQKGKVRHNTRFM
jgi:type IX secretion system PorP/SprF family membrane protein